MKSANGRVVDEIMREFVRVRRMARKDLREGRLASYHIHRAIADAYFHSAKIASS